MSIIAIALILFLVVYGVFTFIGFISSFAQYNANKFLGPYLMLKNLKREYRQVISENMPYYDKLGEKQKQQFEKRVQRFIDIKEFIPRGDLTQVAPEMKAMISGTAIKLTFGYPYVYLSHFWRVLLYDNNYYSNITKRYHKGEVNGKGHIILSWKNFLHGHDNKTDGINLGLHEMAHALRLENAIMNHEYNFLDFNSLYAFNVMAKKEMEKMKSGHASIFRDYASTNEHEFFSVFVENFFERPELVQRHHPKKYACMTKMLLQDPLHPSQIILPPFKF